MVIVSSAPRFTITDSRFSVSCDSRSFRFPINDPPFTAVTSCSATSTRPQVVEARSHRAAADTVGVASLVIYDSGLRGSNVIITIAPTRTNSAPGHSFAAAAYRDPQGLNHETATLQSPRIHQERRRQPRSSSPPLVAFERVAGRDRVGGHSQPFALERRGTGAHQGRRGAAHRRRRAFAVVRFGGGLAPGLRQAWALVRCV